MKTSLLVLPLRFGVRVLHALPACESTKESSLLAEAVDTHATAKEESDKSY